MKKVLLIKNSSLEAPGVIAAVLEERTIPFQIIDLDSGEEFPPVADFGAVVVMGGADSANDQTPKMLQEISRIEDVLQLGIPYLGICLGFQSLVKAAGGSVVKSTLKEIGFRGPDRDFFTVQLTESGLADPIFAGLNPSFIVFQWHGEMVELTDEKQLLAVGKFCRNQAAKVAPRAYGFQCHFEITEKMFAEWINSGTELEEVGAENLKRDFLQVKDEYLAVGRKLTENFLRIAGY